MNNLTKIEDLTEQQLKLTNEIIGDLLHDRPFVLIVGHDNRENVLNLTGNVGDLKENKQLLSEALAIVSKSEVLKYFS